MEIAKTILLNKKEDICIFNSYPLGTMFLYKDNITEKTYFALYNLENVEPEWGEFCDPNDSFVIDKLSKEIIDLKNKINELEYRVYQLENV